jgi:hypothetical protein
LCPTVYKHNIVEGHRQLHLTIQYKLFPWIGFCWGDCFFTFPPLFLSFMGFYGSQSVKHRCLQDRVFSSCRLAVSLLFFVLVR